MANLLAKRFGKDTGFTVGLIILPFIYYPILAYGDSSATPEGEKDQKDQNITIDAEKKHERIFAEEKITDQNKEVAYSIVEDNSGTVVGIWLKDPKKLDISEKGYVEALLVENASHLLGDYLSKKYRKVNNTYDKAGGCFVMFGGNKAPGE